jgi:hypothetical protein
MYRNDLPMKVIRIINYLSKLAKLAMQGCSICQFGVCVGMDGGFDIYF